MKEAPDLDSCLLKDRPHFARALRRLQREPGKPDAGWQRQSEQLAARMQASAAARAHRAARLPEPVFDDALPVSREREQIAAAILANPVTIICGDTGSGKSTQLPKICLSLGRGVDGLVGHTQPRRIAARSIAARVAEELGSPLGGPVGYKVRFTDRVAADTYIKVMTDGILLAEIHSDRQLRQYDTLIIDEAHERSLNIDFLLGYLKRLLPRRPELRVIITSATIEPQRFSRFFDDCPIIEVAGRTFPVEVRYRPPQPDLPSPQAPVLAAVDELAMDGDGDVLVFLSGEREIREHAEALRKHHPPHTAILPLYARQSAAEQDRVFHGHSGRRIVLATNVAETSLTVPGIRYVVDPGFARISRYSHAAKVQRLPVEKISQASADQRRGRCGRVAEGICIRLYAEADFEERPRYTDPEILRTSLAAVILRMLDLGLGDIEEYPFVDVPAPRMINDGYRLLEELHAIDDDRKLTDTGRRMARLPLDPRLARMLVEASQRDCFAEVAVIASGLGIQDPRERPMAAREAADTAHRVFAVPGSDFLSLLTLWDSYHEQRRHLSRSRLRRWCRERFLAYLRMEEWRDLHRQVLEQSGKLGFRPQDKAADPTAIHRSLLSGLIGNVAVREEDDEYRGTRGRRMRIFPGSGIGKKKPRWLMAAMLLETTRLYAHTVAGVKPEWIEHAAAHLLRREYYDPFWDPERQQAQVHEKTSLYGLPLTSGRRVALTRHDPRLARELMVRHALVAGECRWQADFLQHNRSLVAEVESLEHRSRRRDVLVDEDTLTAFYDERIPAEIGDLAGLRAWLKKDQEAGKRLCFDRDWLMRHAAGAVTAERYPPTLDLAGQSLPLHYHFEPGSEDDGVTVDVPLAVLNQLELGRVERLVPGLLEAKLAACIRSLPKSWRRLYVPADEFALAALAAVQASDAPLLEQLADELGRMTGRRPPATEFRPDRVEPHFFMRVRVFDSEGRELAASRDLEKLRAKLSAQATRAFDHLISPVERDAITRWDFGELPETVDVLRDGHRLSGYPALVDDGQSVSLRVFDDAERARLTSISGLRRLFALALGRDLRWLRRNLPGIETSCLHYAPIGACEELSEDILDRVLDEVFAIRDGGICSDKEFESRLAAGRSGLVSVGNRIAELCGRILDAFSRARRALAEVNDVEIADQLRGHLEGLVYPGFVRETPPEWIIHLPRYLEGARIRAQTAAQDPGRDRQRAAQVEPLWRRCREALAASATDPELLRYRWMLEEFRVSLFAQQLRASIPISEKRLEKQWAKVGR